jgi:uncharacterized protein YbjT (DUF2867 family)
VTGPVAVLGASGGTGSLILRRLRHGGREVRAVVRNPATAAELRAAGTDAAVLDLVTAGPADLAAALVGCEVVINAAAGRSISGRTARRVDRDGVTAAVRAAESVGVRRWVQVSMMGSDNRRRVPFILRGVAAAKQQADTFLMASELTWTVLRPPWLKPGPGAGRITVAKNLDGGSLPREDLAEVAVACLDEPATENRVFDLRSGDVPISEALAALSALPD